MCGNLLRTLIFLQAWKKIEDTKKKAVEIMKVRQRNLDNRNEKSSLQEQRAEEERQRAAKLAQDRANQQANIRYNRDDQALRNTNEANRLKQERQQHQEMIEMQKKSDELKAQTMKHMIRGQKEEQKELRAQEQALKRQQQRLDLIRRINEENEKRVQIQTQVARLEKEEADWIRKLQNTSQVQAQAFSELEVALNGDVGNLPRGQGQ